MVPAGAMTVTAFVVALVGFGLLGRASRLPGTEFATVWPAAGMSVRWLIVRHARALSLDTGLLAVTTFALMVATGAPLSLALLPAATNTLPTVAVVELMCLALPERGTLVLDALDAPRLRAATWPASAPAC